jgi:hypothetical protein
VASNRLDTTLDLDSHADTSCLGRGTLIIHDYQTPVQVQGYDVSLGTKQYNIVSGALAYRHPDSGQQYHLVIHQAVHIPDLDHHLLCPMQVRMNDVTVNECPKFLCPAPTPESHAIVALDEHGNDIVLPLMLNGVTSYLPCLSLTQDEWDLANHPRIVLTADHITWSPSATTFSEQEDAMTDHRGDIFTGSHDPPPMIINEIMLSTCAFAADIHSDLNYGRALASHEHVTLSEITNSQNKYGDIKSTRGKRVDGETLAKRWGIDLAKARNTINVTTQRGV